MPDGRSSPSFATDRGARSVRLVAVNPRTGADARCSRPAGGGARVDAVLAYKYPPRTLFFNRRQLVFGGTTSRSDTGPRVLHFPDAPMVFTLLTGNLRRGRPVDAFRSRDHARRPGRGAVSRKLHPHATEFHENRRMLGSVPLEDDGRVQNWGHIPKEARDAIGKGPEQPGNSCNGHTGFFAGG